MDNDYAKQNTSLAALDLQKDYKYSSNQFWPNIPAAVQKYKAVRSITTGSLRSMFEVVASK